jgi:hypothetical protein
MLASTSLAEEGVESIIASTNGLVTWHLRKQSQEGVRA